MMELRSKEIETMTRTEAKAAIREMGMTLSFNSETREYRVNFKDGKEETAYYTEDLHDAVMTASRMAATIEKERR